MTPRGYGIWSRLADQFGLVALKPRLADDVKIRHRGDDVSLVRLSSGIEIAVQKEEADLARQFDGTKTISELIISNMGSAQELDVSTVSRIIDLCVEADFLADFPPNLFESLSTHLAGRTVAISHDPDIVPRDALDDANVETEALATFEQLPWRPRTPLLAERAQFLRNVPLFSELDSWTIGALAEAAHDETYPAMTNVVNQGTESDRFYVVRSGELSVQRREDDGAMHRIARLQQGDYFGETGILDMATRNASVRVGPTRPAQVMRFERESFERIISPHVSEFRGRQLMSKRRTRLERFGVFRKLGPADLERLAHAIHEHRIPSGTVVIRQGDPGDKFYLVVKGTFEVEKNGVVVATLGEGNFFGETALLFTQKRTATVRAQSDSALWSIDGPAFRELVKSHMLSQREIMPTLLNRVASRSSA